MFQKHLLEEATLHYGEFMNDLSKVMVGTAIHAGMPSLHCRSRT